MKIYVFAKVWKVPSTFILSPLRHQPLQCCMPSDSRTGITDNTHHLPLLLSLSLSLILSRNGEKENGRLTFRVSFFRSIISLTMFCARLYLLQSFVVHLLLAVIDCCYCFGTELWLAMRRHRECETTHSFIHSAQCWRPTVFMIVRTNSQHFKSSNGMERRTQDEYGATERKDA